MGPGATCSLLGWKDAALAERQGCPRCKEQPPEQEVRGQTIEAYVSTLFVNATFLSVLTLKPEEVCLRLLSPSTQCVFFSARPTAVQKLTGSN